MFTKILVPTDFSVESNSIFPHAITLAQAFGSKVYMVHVMDPDALKEPEKLVDFPRLSKFLSIDKEDPGLPALKPSVSVARIYAYSKDRAKAIVETIKKKQPDLICMASTTGNRSLAWWSAGPVMEKVIAKAPCPVLCMRGRDIAEKDWQRPRFKHLLLLTEMENNPGEIFESMLPWAQAFDSMVHIFPLHRGDAPAAGKAALEQVGEKLPGSRAELLNFPNPKARTRNLLDFVAQSSIDMVAMAAGTRSRFSLRFANDILVRLLKATDCPVLILR